MVLFDHAALGRLRQAGPVHRVESEAGIPFWMVTRWDEARQVLTEPSLSKRQPVDGLPPALRAAMSTQMLLQDPPVHTRLRKLVSAAFTARRIAELEPRIVLLTDRLLDGLTDGDLIDGLAFPLPFEVICELLGIPADERGPFRAWSNTIILGEFGTDAFTLAIESIVDYLRELLDRKRADRSDDLLGALVGAESADVLSSDELVSMAILLLVAGHETTVNLIGNAVYLLCRWPAQKQRLLDDPALVPVAVEETLRLAGPSATTTYRVTTSPLTVGGTTIPAGEQVLVSLLSANRDESRFTAPDDFDLNRHDGGHLAFGHGIHFCLGAPLARLEARVALTRLLARFPETHLAVPPEELRWRTGLLMHGLLELPVHLSATPGR
ncbi:cytochrome P450 [Actinoplanes sp. L3-i22]|uniref:cytochrome P450 family protein n=1 Tax=Actinoplanes sp. L3-i22 TaxID=2836373 RepID=UPI001C754BBB|nr:cytochrome P450 [Actinoplanes sp. L3-i22]BCY11927.1 cytochrome P450 [Actinoplanes sp. L3-i22]